MKILQVHDYPPLEGGGIEVNVSRVSAEMVRQGHEVTVATSRTSSETFESRANGVVQDFNGVKIAVLENFKDLRALIDKAEVVHIHFTFSCRPASMFALEYCVDSGTPCVLSVRTNTGHIPFSALAKLSGLERDKILDRLRANLNAENVFLSAPSYSTKESLKRIGVDKEVYVIRNGLSRIPQEVAANAGEQKEAGNLERVDITYIGEVSILKGTNYLIDAVRSLRKDLPDLQLRIIGGGSDMPQIRQMVEFFGLESNVRFCGYVANDLIPDYLQATKLVVHPSLTETWCNAVAEALAFKVPVISTAVEGLRELTQEGKFARLVEPADSSAMAAAILEVLSSESAYTELAKKANAASEYLIANNTLANQVKQSLNLYQQVTSWETKEFSYSPHTPTTTSRRQVSYSS